MRLPGCPTLIAMEDIERLERLIATDWTVNADWVVQWSGIISTNAPLPCDSCDKEVRRTIAFVEQTPDESSDACIDRAQLIAETHTYLPALLAEIRAWRALAANAKINVEDKMSGLKDWVAVLCR
jgi:hypothetical protein